MADDIDDLLDEVESKFCDKKAKKLVTKNASETQRPNLKKGDSSTNTSWAESDLSDAVRDILDEDGLDLEPTNLTKKSSVVANNAGIKCFPIFIAGPSRSVKDKTQRVCERLHCTTCDNKVVYFENFQWNNSCDYLFFRNNYPDFSKLKGNFIPSQGSRAYCCQCSWTAVNTLVNLNQHTNFKWICKRH